jgi:hypothetical protein
MIAKGKGSSAGLRLADWIYSKGALKENRRLSFKVKRKNLARRARFLS